MIRKLTAAALGAASALVATSALAQDPAAAPAPAAAAPAAASAPSDSGSAGGASVALLLGYGFASVGPSGFSFNPYEVGFGVRGGYTLPNDLGPGHLYLGGTFVYHLGESEGGTTIGVWYLGVEGGYEIPAGPVTVRPEIGLGDLQSHGSPTGNSGAFYFYPGATVLYPVSSNIGVGIDLRYIIASSNGESINGLGLYLTGQYHF